MEGNHYLVEKLYFIAFIYSYKTYDTERSASYGHECRALGTLASMGAFQGPAHQSGLNNDALFRSPVFPPTNLNKDAFFVKHF